MGVSTYIQYIKKSFLKFKSLLTGGNERSYVLEQTCGFETYKGSVGGGGRQRVGRKLQLLHPSHSSCYKRMYPWKL